MGPAEGSNAVDGRVARPGAGGVVSRTGLFERLGASARVTVISAPPGSGKSVLLRSWIGEAGLMDSTGWVSVGRDDRDPQRFWLSALGAPAPYFCRVEADSGADGGARSRRVAVERLLRDLAPLQDRLWLVVDDAHELGSAEARSSFSIPPPGSCSIALPRIAMTGPPWCRDP